MGTMSMGHGNRAGDRLTELDKQVEVLASALRLTRENIAETPARMKQYNEFKRALATRILELFKESPEDGLYERGNLNSPLPRLNDIAGHLCSDVVRSMHSAEDQR